MTPKEGQTVKEALKILKRHHRRGSVLTGPDVTRQFLKLKLGFLYNEVFGCIYLDNHNRVLAMEELFQGTVDGATVHSRVLVQRVLEHNAAAVVFYHNHPSGVSEPSEADKRLTQRLTDALALVDVRILDHLIIGEEVASFAELGLI
jgi:DNA repair protein RadC